MHAHFAEVLARESACLAGVTDMGKLADWRHRLVAELANPLSPYASAIRQTDNVVERADFLDSWCSLITITVDRLLQPDGQATSMLPAGRRRSEIDPHSTAVLILAALHGGSTLSQVAQGPGPLNAALDIALAPFAPGKPAT